MFYTTYISQKKLIQMTAVSVAESELAVSVAVKRLWETLYVSKIGNLYRIVSNTKYNNPAQILPLFIFLTVHRLSFLPKGLSWQ